MSLTTRPLVLFREVPTPTAEDPNAVKRVPVGAAMFEPTWQEVLFLADTSHPPPNRELQVHAMDDSLDAFPWRTVVAFNSLKVPLLGKIGADTFELPPGASPASPLDVGEFGLHVAFAIEREERAVYVFENRLDLHPHQRVLLILAPPRRPSSLRVSAYHVAQPEPPPSEGVGPSP